MQEDLLNYEPFDLESIVQVARHGVKSLEDLADLAGDELAEMLPNSGLDAESAGRIVMDARVRLGWIAPEDLLPAETPAATEDQDEEGQPA